MGIPVLNYERVASPEKREIVIKLNKLNDYIKGLLVGRD